MPEINIKIMSIIKPAWIFVRSGIKFRLTRNTTLNPWIFSSQWYEIFLLGSLLETTLTNNRVENTDS